jgi:hypothetical protein
VSVKTNADLALADKIDLARTLVRFKHRRQSIRELNDVEDAITKRHNAEIADGSFTEIDLDGIGVGSLAKELPSGDSSVSASSGDAEQPAA